MNKYIAFGLGLGESLLKGASVAAVGCGVSHLAGAAYGAAGRSGWVSDPSVGGVRFSDQLTATGDFMAITAGGTITTLEILNRVSALAPEVKEDVLALAASSTAVLKRLRDKVTGNEAEAPVLGSAAAADGAPAAAAEVAPAVAAVSAKEVEDAISKLMANGMSRVEAIGMVNAALKFQVQA